MLNWHAFEYYVGGQKRKEVSSDGVETEYTYDSLNRLVKIVQRSQAIELVKRLGYDKASRELWVQEPGGNVTSHEYNTRG